MTAPPKRDPPPIKLHLGPDRVRAAIAWLESLPPEPPAEVPPPKPKRGRAAR